MIEQYRINGEWVDADRLPGFYPTLFHAMQDRDDQGRQTPLTREAERQALRLLIALPIRFIVPTGEIGTIDQALLGTLSGSTDPSAASPPSTSTANP